MLPTSLVQPVVLHVLHLEPFGNFLRGRDSNWRASSLAAYSRLLALPLVSCLGPGNRLQLSGQAEENGACEREPQAGTLV